MQKHLVYAVIALDSITNSVQNLSGFEWLYTLFRIVHNHHSMPSFCVVTNYGYGFAMDLFEFFLYDG